MSEKLPGNKVQLIIDADFKSIKCVENLSDGVHSLYFLLRPAAQGRHTPTQFGLSKSLSLLVFSDVQQATPEKLCLFKVICGALGF